MKVKITMELDLAGTFYNIDTEDDLKACIENLSFWLGDLKSLPHEKKCSLLAGSVQEPMFSSCMKHYNDDVKLGEEMFKNISFSGITEDGKEFLIESKC